MSEKKNQVAPTAKEQKPEESKHSEASEKRAVPSFAKPPVLPASIRNINPNMLETAKNIGIPLDGIFDYIEKLQAWADGAEARINSIVNNFEPVVKATVRKMAVEEVQANQQSPVQSGGQPQAPPSQGGGMPQAALGLLQQIAPLLGQSGDNSMFGTEFQTKAANAMAESFFGDLAMGKTIRNAITQRLTGKLVDDIVKSTVAAT